jgi:hypothetical protein
VRVLPVSEKSDDYAQALCDAELKSPGRPRDGGPANDRVQAKIKNAARMKIPYTAVVGPRDEEAGAVNPSAPSGSRRRSGRCRLDEFVEGVVAEIECKGSGSRPRRCDRAVGHGPFARTPRRPISPAPLGGSSLPRAGVPSRFIQGQPALNAAMNPWMSARS